jgi:hypothetical protein
LISESGSVLLPRKCDFIKDAKWEIIRTFWVSPNTTMQIPRREAEGFGRGGHSDRSRGRLEDCNDITASKRRFNPLRFVGQEETPGASEQAYPLVPGFQISGPQNGERVHSYYLKAPAKSKCHVDPSLLF